MDQTHDDSLLRQIRQLRLRMEEVALSSQKLRVIGLSTTANQNNPDLYIGSFREDEKVAYANLVFQSLQHLPRAIAELDGVPHFFALDSEIKNDVREIASASRGLIRRSGVHYVRPNEMTIEGVDTLSQICIGDISTCSVAICGMGRIGTALARRFTEYGNSSLTLVTRDVAATKERFQENGQKSLIPLLKTYQDFTSRSRGVDLALLCASTSGVFTAKMVPCLSSRATVMDIGGGCVAEDSLPLLQDKEMRSLSFTIMPRIMAYFHSLQGYRAISGKISTRKVGKYTLVSLGHLGKKGDVLVDDVLSPCRVFGVCDGLGGIVQTDVTLKGISS